MLQKAWAQDPAITIFTEPGTVVIDRMTDVQARRFRVDCGVLGLGSWGLQDLVIFFVFCFGGCCLDLLP